MKDKGKIDFSLYLVTDKHLSGFRGVEAVTTEALEGWVTVVQFRDKNGSTKNLLETALKIKAICSLYNIPFIVNDRVDIAIACEADGVHIGQDDMPLSIVRKFLGEEAVIGVSVGTVEEAINAQNGGADYLGISPIWATPTKTDTPPEVGLSGIRKIRKAVKIPLVGIGGINAKNAASVIKAGCDGVAVVSAIMASSDPKSAAMELLGIVRQAKRK